MTALHICTKMLQEKNEWINRLAKFRSKGEHEKAEEIRKEFILQGADRAENMGQVWIAGMLRRRAEREDIVYRRECRACRLYFEPSIQSSVYCSDSCRENGQITRIRKRAAKNA